MVDIHTHILPGIDDGSQSMEMSLEMARQALLGGSRHLVASSHWNQYPYSLQEYWETLEETRMAFKKENLPVKLYTGQELMLNDRAIRLLQREEVLTINNTRYLLVEFDFEENPDRMLYLLHQVRKRNYIPIVAHPERYFALQDDYELASAFRMAGCILQSNGGSLLGDFGKIVQHASRYLLRQGLVQVLATDAHEDRYRTPNPDRLMQWLKENYNERQIKLLTSENPSRIIKGSPVLIERQEKKVVQE